MKKSRVFVFAIYLACWGPLFACGRSDPPVPLEPAIAEVAGLRPERTYYVKSASGAIFGGFDGALERPIVAGGMAIEPDANGRFRIELPADQILAVEALSYRLRDPDEARVQAVRPAISGAGSVPNDLVIAAAAGRMADAFGVLVRSGDRGVSVLDLDRGLTPEGVRVDGHPFFAGVIDPDARRVAVSDYESGEIHLIDLRRGKIERSLAPPEVTLARPFPLSRPYDLDGDGAEELEVVQFVARSPQSVIAAGDRLLVGFSGFTERWLDVGRPAVFVPGVIASWSLSDLSAPPELLVLDALNPQEIRMLSDGTAIAVCSGILETNGGARAITGGAITIFDPSSLAVIEQIDLRDFAPGSALIAADNLVVSSLVRATVRLIGETTKDLELNDETTDSVFRLVDLGGGLVGVPSFNTDRLHILDARTGALNPEPFFGPLAIGPGRPLFDGLQIVAARPGRRGVDFTGPDLLALTGQASELIPIELRKVLGP